MSDLWIWPLVGTFFIGLFLAAAVASRPGDRPAKAWLALLLLTAAFFAAEFAAMRSGLYRYPVFFVTYPTFFLIGPAAWFLSRALVGAAPTARQVLPHLVPAVAMALDFLPYYLDMAVAGGQPAHGGRNWSGLGPYPQCLIQLAHTGGYVVAAVIGFRRVEGRAQDQHSSAFVLRIRWARRVAITLGVVIVVEIGAALAMMGSGRHVNSVEYVMGFAVAALVVALGWMVLREPEALEVMRPATPKYERSTLDAESVAKYAELLVRTVEDGQLWLNPHLRLADLAEASGVSRHQLSQVLSRGFGRSFFEFVNAYRVREAARQLLSEDLGDKTMLAVAYDAGFSSKASFNRVFKESLGLTPSQFRSGGSLEDLAIRPLQPLDSRA